MITISFREGRCEGVSVREQAITAASLDRYRVDLPDGTSGRWRVARYFVDDRRSRIELLQTSLLGIPRFAPPGWYTGLFHDDELIMSDTPDEIRDHLAIIARASGHVLMHGLGLGLCLQAMLQKPEVEHVLVIERSPDVIRLVADHYLRRFGRGRLTVREGDAFTWQPSPGSWWDLIWHDIWPTLAPDNLSEIGQLHEGFRKNCAFQDSWGRDTLIRLTRYL
jgi:hypothetical protein